MMKLSKEEKVKLFETFSANKSAQDTGSAEAQIALFSHRIKHLTEHLKVHKKDNATRLGLIKLVGKRTRLLKHLKNNDITRYRGILASLGLRK